MNFRSFLLLAFSHYIFSEFLYGELTTIKDADTIPLSSFCFQVSSALFYYKTSLEHYNYNEENCSNFEKIGNYVLEKHNLGKNNCYKNLQKPICKLSYEMRESKSNNKEFDIEKEKTEYEKTEYEKTENEKNTVDVPINDCEKTQKLFLTLVQKCVEEKIDPLIHCASFNKKNKTITDPELFCSSSYFRKEGKENKLQKSIYGENYKNISVETYSFKSEEIPDCINIVNNFNTCSVIGQSVFNNTFESCLFSSSSLSSSSSSSSSSLSSNNINKNLNYCDVKIKRVVNNDYIFSCADILLPYLISFKNERNTYTELCYNIKNYVVFLKEEKSFYLKEKRKLEEAIKNIKIKFHLSQTTETYFNELKEQMEQSFPKVNTFFNTIKRLKNRKVLSQSNSKIELNKLYQQIMKLYNAIQNCEYPLFDQKSNEENFISFQKTKSRIDKMSTIETDILNIIKILTDFIQKKKNANFSDETTDHINVEEFLKLRNIYEDAKNIISDFATRNKNTNMNYYKSQEQDFLTEIEKLKQLIEVNSDQIGLLIKKKVV